MDDTFPSSTLDDARQHVVAAGELDLASAPELTAALQAVTAGTDTLVIDVAALTFCDSSGLRALIAATGDRTVVLKSPPPQLLRLLELTNTSDLFEIAP